MKTGDIVKVTGDKAKVIDDISCHIQAMKTLAGHAGEMINIYNTELWGVINEVYPETADRELAYNHKKKEIHIKCKIN